MKDKLARLFSGRSNNTDTTTADASQVNEEESAAQSQANAADEFSYDVGSAPDINLNDPDAYEKIFYHPENFLQGHVQHVLSMAIKNGAAMRLSGIGFKSIVVDPARQSLASAVALRSLLSAGRIPLAYKNMQLDPVSAREAETLFNGENVYNVKTIIWQLALGASRGRLPANTSLDAPISLLHWPNLTRLQVTPHATRILSLWSHDERSLRETVAALNIPQRYVFALYSACSSIGLIQEGKQPDQPPRARSAVARESSAQTQQKQTLFRMLLNKLKF